ncbi:uncharacterized protein LOC115775767 isoform X2 [Archocentrus centrarchus]|nr:uncharacterized protein LOC115775767 isoform X2 [Archocentrus centrarchus]XP_030579157.1 uncharacterized protein LOC115775767 isoform X2 [Archocentrus centrarchus]
MEVYAGEKSILLPCQYSGFPPEDDPAVMWTRSDLDPKSVHLLQKGGDDLSGQNQHYSGRTSVRSDALKTGNYSLTLRNPQLTDSGSYTCSITDGREEKILRDLQLQVKDQQVEVKVEEGSESVILPCKTPPDLPEDTRVEWTRSDRKLTIVHVYANRSNNPENQHCHYCDRTNMTNSLLRTGDLSLTLKYPTQRDTGGYICTIYRDKDILRQKVVLQHVKAPFPSWVTALLVFLVLLPVVSGGLLFHFRHYFMSLIPVEVEVELGAESVRLPFKTTKNLPADAKVMWERYDPRKMVYVFCREPDETEQHEDYRDRTEMNEDPLTTGDLTLTLTQPRQEDSGEYKCLVWRRGDFIRKKSVLLTVKVIQVEVEEGAESVRLPIKITRNLPADAKVMWERYDPRKMVYVFCREPDETEQHGDYRDRTEMNEDPLTTGDLTLTLTRPRQEDSGEYRCLVWRRGDFIRKKSVLLTVRGLSQVEEGGEEAQVDRLMMRSIH